MSLHTCTHMCQDQAHCVPGRMDHAPRCVPRWPRRTDARLQNPSPYPAGRSPCSSSWPAGMRHLQSLPKPTPSVSSVERQEPQSQQGEVKQDPCSAHPFLSCSQGLLALHGALSSEAEELSSVVNPPLCFEALLVTHLQVPACLGAASSHRPTPREAQHGGYPATLPSLAKQLPSACPATFEIWLIPAG